MKESRRAIMMRLFFRVIKFRALQNIIDGNYNPSPGCTAGAATLSQGAREREGHSYCNIMK
jgi:hypothetical protein